MKFLSFSRCSKLAKNENRTYRKRVYTFRIWKKMFYKFQNLLLCFTMYDR
jgi:hypothetical protein